MKQEKMWDYYQNENKASFASNRGRLSTVFRMISGKDIVLNIGIGEGALEEMCEKGSMLFYSLDPSEKAIDGLRRRYHMGERAKVGYSQNIPFEDGMFDAVVMSEVIEHLKDDVLKDTLNEVRRVLKQGGIFVGTVPADENLDNEMVVCPDCGLVFHRVGHVQSFTEERLRSILKENFNISSIRRRYFPTWEILGWKGYIHAIVKVALSFIGSHGKKESILFVASTR